MIRERFAFVLIYCVLSSLYPASSWASKQSRHIETVEISRDLTTINSKLNGSRNSITSSPEQQKILASSEKTSTAERAIDRANTIEPEQPVTTITRRWCGIAMGVTGGACLFLLWLLFRKPQHTTESATESNTDKTSPESTEVLPADRLSDRGKTETDMEPIDIDDSTQKNAAANIALVEELIRDLQQPDSDSSSISANVAVSPQVELKRRAIWKLAQIGDHRSVEPLLKILPSASTFERDLIFRAVTQIVNRSFEPADRELFTNLQHQDPQIRLSALRSLKQMYQFTCPAIIKIAAMQSDPDREVRQTATQTLQQLNIDWNLPSGDCSNLEVDRPVSKEESINLHLVAYLLAETDSHK